MIPKIKLQIKRNHIKSIENIQELLQKILNKLRFWRMLPNKDASKESLHTHMNAQSKYFEGDDRDKT